MKTRLFVFLLLWFFIGPLLSFAQVKIIFDTDFGGDADDLGALVMLHNFMDRGECELLGVMSWSTEESVIPAIDAVRKGIGSYWDRIEGGYCLADEHGGNLWIKKNTSNHSYLKLIQNPEEMANLIESIMLNQF